MLRGVRKKIGRKISFNRSRSRSRSQGRKSADANRSVNDFSSPEDLKRALLSNIEGSCNCSEASAFLFSKNEDVLKGLLGGSSTNDENDPAANDGEALDPSLDWVLENYDEKKTKKQSVQDEVRRLLVLKSYLVLDTDRQESFERVTGLASTHFNCPIALISLVDIGRQWFLSNRGLGKVRETSRKLAFCAHTIMSKDDTLIVLDATMDSRFKRSPLVTGPPDIRFYAGAPLISPEGFKLGTLCVIDNKPRSLLSLEDKEYLKELAAMAVQTLVDHRRNMSVWFNNLVSTHFPDFQTMEDSTDGGDSGGEEKCAIEDQYQEDRDVADFLETTKRMPLESILSMLQNQARAQHVSPSSYKGAPHPILKTDKHERVLREQKFRFADDSADEICKVECWKNIKELWWKRDEIQAMQTDCLKTVQHFRKHRPDYIQCIQSIAKNQGSLDDSIRMILKESNNVRGLEAHIAASLMRNRQITVQAVLREQDECKDDNDDFDTISYCLREQSLTYSQLSAQFAQNMGQCDQIDALIIES